MPTASTPVALVIFLSRSLKTLKTELNQNPAILTEQVWPIKDLSHSKNISLYKNQEILVYFKRWEREPTAFVAQ